MKRLATIITLKLRRLKQITAQQLSSILTRASLQIHHRQNRNRKVILFIVCASYLFGVVFTLFEFDAYNVKKWHPYYEGITYQNGEHWDGRVSDAVFWYGFMEMVVKASIFLAAGLAIWLKIRTRIFWVCLPLEVLDMIDYRLTRNGPWFTLDHFLIFDNWEFEFNYVKILIIFLFSASEWDSNA